MCCIGRRFVVVDEDVEYHREVVSEESVQVGKSLVLLAGWHPSAGMVAGVTSGGTSGNRQRSIARAMAVAGRNATLPPSGKRAVGDPNGPADETDRAGAAMPLPRTSGGIAWVHQENALDAR